MTWRTHVAGGIGATSLLLPLVGPSNLSETGILAACAAFGALLPDLDAAQSKIRSLSFGGVRPFEPLGAAANYLFGHRGFLHSLPGLALIALASAATSPWIGWLPALALWLGYASHLALDACTRSGIPGSGHRLFLAPRRLRIVTGSPDEDLYFVILAAAAIAVLLLSLRRATFPQT